MMMIHNPMTIAFGDKAEMKRAISMLDEIKDSIINAYEIKTSLSRDKISKLMDEETWMNANKAMEMGFCDDIMKREINEDLDSPSISSMYSSVKVMNHLMDKIATKAKIKGLKKDVKAEELNNRLNLIKTWR